MSEGSTSGTSPARFSASRADWVERLFGRLAANYGSVFADRWAGVNPEEVKREWARRLDGMPAYRIGHALDNLPKWPPTLPEFLEICSEAPLRPVPSNVTAIPTLPREAERVPTLEERREMIAALKAMTAKRNVTPTAPTASTSPPAEPASCSTSP